VVVFVLWLLSDVLGVEVFLLAPTVSGGDGDGDGDGRRWRWSALMCATAAFASTFSLHNEFLSKFI
jgi:hypothetical protein